MERSRHFAQRQHPIAAPGRGQAGDVFQLADIVEKYCRKGERVYVEGSIEYGQYKDKEGQTRYTTDIKVRELMLLGGIWGEGREGFDFAILTTGANDVVRPVHDRMPCRTGTRSCNAPVPYRPEL